MDCADIFHLRQHTLHLIYKWFLDQPYFDMHHTHTYNTVCLGTDIKGTFLEPPWSGHETAWKGS